MGDVITLVSSDKAEFSVDRARAVQSSRTIRNILEDQLVASSSSGEIARIDLPDIPSITLREIARVIMGANARCCHEELSDACILAKNMVPSVQFIIALNYLDMPCIDNYAMIRRLNGDLVMFMKRVGFVETARIYGIPDSDDAGLLKLREATKNPKLYVLVPCEEYEVGTVAPTVAENTSLLDIPKDVWVRYILPKTQYHELTRIALLHPRLYHMIVDYFHCTELEGKIMFSIFFNNSLQQQARPGLERGYTKSEVMRAFDLEFRRFKDCSNYSGIYSAFEIIRCAYVKHGTVAKLNLAVEKRKRRIEQRTETKRRKMSDKERIEEAWKPLFLERGFTKWGFAASVRDLPLPALELGQIKPSNKRAREVVDQRMDGMQYYIETNEFDKLDKYVTRPVFKEIVAKYA